jgi:hypothetical protein
MRKISVCFFFQKQVYISSGHKPLIFRLYDFHWKLLLLNLGLTHLKRKTCNSQAGISAQVMWEDGKKRHYKYSPPIALASSWLLLANNEISEGDAALNIFFGCTSLLLNTCGFSSSPPPLCAEITVSGFWL